MDFDKFEGIIYSAEQTFLSKFTSSLRLPRRSGTHFLYLLCTFVQLEEIPLITKNT